MAGIMLPQDASCLLPLHFKLGTIVVEHTTWNFCHLPVYYQDSVMFSGILG
jgi:hypothetical protein